MLRTTVAASLLALGAATLSAQDIAPPAQSGRVTPTAAVAHPLVGTWRLNYQIGMGPDGPINGGGTMTLALKGDSLIGEILADRSAKAPIDLPPAKPARIAAKAGTGTITFISTTSATARSKDGGAMGEATVISTWSLLAKGDSISGMVGREMEMMGGRARLEPAPLTGVRAKG